MQRYRKPPFPYALVSVDPDLAIIYPQLLRSLCSIHSICERRNIFIIMSSRSQRSQETLPKLRQACDMCHHAKVKCSDDEPCARCRDNNLQCSRSYAIKAGKPKGSKNRKTLEKLEQIRLEAEKAQIPTPPGSQDPRTAGGNRKRSRVSQDEYCGDVQNSRVHGFDAGPTPPLTYHDLEPIGNNADNIFPISVS